MKYIVTGGAGFIGSHVADALIEKGHQVLIIDDLSSGKKENINPRAEFYRLNIVEEKAIAPLFQKGIDGVFHLAALARIQPSFENPDLYFRVNAAGTRNILALAKKYGIKRVVYSASSSAYGFADIPLREDCKLTSQALHPYGSTKRMGEMLMKDMGKMTGGPETVCLRYFNVYGPRQTTASDGAYATVIGIFWELRKKDESLPIVPDGHQRRDFTHVNDVVAANLLAMTSPKIGNGEIINIGTGKNYSVWEIAKLILGAAKTVKPEQLISQGKCYLLPPRRGEVRETLADIALAKKLLGWEPGVSFDKGIKELLSRI